MKISLIIGSPRINGNSATIAKIIADTLVKKGAVTTTFELNSLNYRGCQSCMACKSISEKCILKDDLDHVLEDIRTSDTIIFATPVFVGEITSQLKGLVDRFYSFFKNDFRTNPKPSRLTDGKKLVFVVSQGSPDINTFSDIIPRYSGLLSRLGFSNVIPVRAIGVGPGSDILKNDTITASINEAVDKVIAG
jgi:multimeric flavodoxin WrbA